MVCAQYFWLGWLCWLLMQLPESRLTAEGESPVASGFFIDKFIALKSKDGTISFNMTMWATIHRSQSFVNS